MKAKEVMASFMVAMMIVEMFVRRLEKLCHAQQPPNRFRAHEKVTRKDQGKDQATIIFEKL